MSAPPNGSPTLAVFVRLPRPGVKSRLAASIGTAAAAEFYRLCAEQTLREVAGVPDAVAKYICYSDRRDEAAIRQWAGSGFELIPQADGDLGVRLIQAFRQLFAAGWGQVIITASDTPDLTAPILTQAIQRLADHAVVLGPACDGGYYLIGLKSLYETLFHDIDWGSEQVLTQTRHATEALGLSVGYLPMLRDIDTAADLRDWLGATRDDGREVLAYARNIMI